jgi:hypothetical protein
MQFEGPVRRGPLASSREEVMPLVFFFPSSSLFSFLCFRLRFPHFNLFAFIFILFFCLVYGYLLITA